MQPCLNTKQKLLKVWAGMKLLSLAAPRQFLDLSVIKMLESLMAPIATCLLALLIKTHTTPFFQITIICALALLIFAEQIIYPITEQEKRTLSAKLKAYIDNRLMQKIENMDDVYLLEQKHIRDQVIKFKSNDYFTILWLNILSQTFGGILKIIFALILLVPIFSYKVLILVVVLIPKLLQQVKINNANFEGRHEVVTLRKKTEYPSEIILNSDFAAEIKVFNLVPFFKNIYQTNAHLLKKILLKDYKKLSFNQLGWNILEGIIILSLFVYLLLFTPARGQDLFIAFTALNQINAGINNLFALLAIGPREANYLIDLVNFLAIPDCDYKFTNGPIENIDTITCKAKDIFQLKNLAFSYQPDNFKLHIDDLALPEQAIIAFVGKNGSGKSTLLKLLSKIYHPQQGYIYLRQSLLASYHSKELWRNYSAVFQDFARYKTTLRENIILGNLAKAEDMPAIHQALILSQFKLENFKDGLNTKLGLDFGGQELSGGEWQKLALARAFMKLDHANILLFDEASANLDAEAMFKLFKTLQVARSKGKTILFVTHQFTTAAKADYIVMLDQGTVIEYGTHAQLIEKEGLYAKLHSMQEELAKGGLVRI